MQGGDTFSYSKRASPYFDFQAPDRSDQLQHFLQV